VTGIGPLKNSAGNLVTEKSEMEKELNKFFTSVFTTDNAEPIPHLSEVLEQCYTDRAENQGKNQRSKERCSGRS
jgi:hypothetical protein